MKSESQKSLSPKDINNMVQQYLISNKMLHTAFCFKHEAKLPRTSNLPPNKLVSLLNKGFLLENLENESKEMLNRLDKQVKDYTSTSLRQNRSLSRDEEDTLKREISLKQYISGKIQSELDKLMEGSLSSMRQSRTTFSSAFSNTREDSMPLSMSFHEHSMNRMGGGSGQNKQEVVLGHQGKTNIPEIAFRTGNFNKKSHAKMTKELQSTHKRHQQKLSAHIPEEIKKQLSQSQIDIDKYNSKFSFAQSGEDKKMKNFMFKTHHGRFSHNKSKSLAYSFDGTSDKPPNNLTSFDTLANMETVFFHQSDSHGYRCHEFKSYKHHLLSFDKNFKKVALLNMDRRLRGLGEGNTTGHRPKVFKISEELRSKNPRIVFDNYAIFFTQNEFIVFDYQYSLFSN
jgi:hypothetical protein